jgi:hypothetical protein
MKLVPLTIALGDMTSGLRVSNFLTSDVVGIVRRALEGLIHGVVIACANVMHQLDKRGVRYRRRRW